MFSPPRPSAIPPSPTSPPKSGLKRRRPSDIDSIPQTPISPPFMSVATKSYVSAYGNSHNTDDVSGRSSPQSPALSGPRAVSSSHNNPRSATSIPTPANSVTGIPGLEMIEDNDQHRDKRARLDHDGDEDMSRMEIDSTTQPTNHDRQDSRDMDGQQGQNSGFTDGRSQTAMQQQKDLGEPFLLRRSKIRAQGPDPQQHLLAMYGLGPLLRSVARTDPKTGEKINKLRKSYEGQVKMFGLAGKTRTIKGERNVDEDQPGPLRRMVGSTAWGLETDEQWNATHGSSKIEVTADFKSKLKQAAQIQPGLCANNQWWENELGLADRPRIPPTVQQPPVSALGPSRIPNGVQRPLPGQAGEAKRSTRGKKRSYSDDSFVGYGEGYSEGEDAGTGDEYGGTRKRRKDIVGHTPVTYGQYAGR
ncbi:hypothetical protein PV10_05935 [Exophiala mesophila]|uniref:Mediator of RNA polymerase II transcription subunit 19 n=1 Tax=Exophiala mesophila TaxID=212818 RepID=A0A0D1XTB6_EXOME|nr:uncharacterized protein PV10_05935 [Exophiala mesophila]KIV91391.1 hypothetical protein PV10_05935 [Exophiala mesophila]